MADTESLGEAGVRWLEQLAALPREQRQVRLPTMTDPQQVFGVISSLRDLGKTDPETGVVRVPLLAL